ncbi:Serine/threonine-protein kinase PRP4-like protein [Phytophthora ramorum]|uniref:Serine/threonine-protein kinase PRP4-like protein n=1 Tax=Phytophthora ramorum TaxID=164328 RepID=UPI0030A44EC8|nr:Serine/threonine-protein kinase PRP4-like protein [Phytophthora ramorum]
MAAELHRSDRRADRRPHHPRSRSASPSRTRRASHHRSSRRRSRSPSRSRERSRRAHRHSHRRHRSRSPPRERHKRRRRESDEKRDRHHARSRSRSRSTSKAQQKPCNETIEKASVSEDAKAEKQQQKAVINGEKKDVAVDQDAVMEDASEAPQVQESKEQAAVEQREEVQTSNPVSVESAETQEPASAVKPALDVSSIKKDILKALADARSTIAGIKKTGAAASVPTTPTPTPADVDMNKDEEQLTSPDKPQKEVVESPQKAAASPVMAPTSPKKAITSPKKVITSPKKVITSPKKAVTSPKEAFTSPKEATTAPIASADEFDMFSMAALDDHDDAMNGSTGVAAITVNEVSLQSNCDDAEGYYSTTIGEVLNGKYRVLGTVGKGVFSTVLRCQCLTPLKTAGDGSLDVVAIKLIRNNDIMRDAAQTELKLLNELGERDPRDKKHCIRLLDSFSHRNHVAMVFEPMQMNVREAMKKFGGKGGISIQAVRIFSKHLLIALNHLESCEVIHADIKPDNILLDEKQSTIKVCDFGSAFKTDDGKQDPTPYLVSRFYRAPEIVLGLAYDKAVDMWSVGCCLFEMFTGKVMFPGSTNNEMLKFFMELKGKIPNKLIKKHRQAYIDQFEMEPHFTEDLKFCSRESDRVTGKPILRLMDTIKTKSDLAGSLMAAKSATDDRKQVLALRSLLDRMFSLDPSKRISVRDALAHPFVKG